MRLLVCCLFLLSLSRIVAAQNMQPRLPAVPYEPADTNALYLSLSNANFLKNNEFFNDYVSGYTKLGFFFKPEFNYTLSPKTTLSAGAHFLKYSGSDQFQEITPVFTIRHQLARHINLVMGTLDNERNHHLIDPIYHFENYLNRHVENGLQFLVDHPALRGDVWINWQQFIPHGANFHEQFEAGVTTNVALTGKGRPISVQLPFQLLVQHKGGQVNQSDKPVSTLYNAASGLSLSMQPKTRLLDKITFRNLLALYQDGSPQKLQPYDQGHALYSSLILKRKKLSLEMSYWNAHQFLSFSGNPLFQAYSMKKSTVLDSRREMLVGRLNYARKYRHLQLLVNVDSYYDVQNASLDFGFGLYLLLNTSIFLHKGSQ
jgi:hypothetical protein